MHKLTLTASDGEVLTGQLPASWAEVPLQAYADLVAAAAIGHELGYTPDHVNVLLRQHGLTCAPADLGRPAGTRFAPGSKQRAVIQQFQASRVLVSGLASAVGCPTLRRAERPGADA